MTIMEKNTKIKPKNKPTPCESCVHYDAIDEYGTLGCTVDVDEDDLYRERTDRHQGCPYYKFYDEYKSVRRQN